MRARRSLAQFALVIAAAVAAPADSGELIPVKNTTALGVTVAGPTTIETTSIGATGSACACASGGGPDAR